MKIEQININKIVPYENNPRKNDKAVDAVAKSIEQCGYIAPIIVDENMIVLAGHTRLKALKQLGYDIINVAIVAGLTDEQKRKYRLLDNKTAELATWDMDILQDELDSLNFDDLCFLDWQQNEEETTAEKANRKEIDFVDNISVVVECEDEQDAEIIYTELLQRGYKCRISTL